MRMFGHPQGLLGRLGGIVMARMNASAAAEIVDLLDVATSDRVLELGFGPGVGIGLLAERVSTGYVCGVDPSLEMVEQGTKRNLQAIRRGVVELRLGAAESLPFAANTFDKALAVNSMQLWTDVEAGLREVLRVLKTGARIALGFTSHSGQRNEGLTDRLQAAGFSGIDIVEQKKWFCVLASKL